MRLLITVDAEEDDAWSAKQELSTENVRHIPRFQHLCEEYGYRPTWLANEPVLHDGRFAEALAGAVDRGWAEIGAHLHPWSCGPFPAEQAPQRPGRIYPHEIGEQEFRIKMARLVGGIRQRFGRGTSSYRAGRWGFDAWQIPCLLDLGIRLDCSVTPHISWHEHRGHPDGKGGPDFRGASMAPYWLDSRDVRMPGDSGLLELPMTVLYARGPFASLSGAWGGLSRLRYTPIGKAMARLGWMPRLFRPYPGTRLSDLLGMERLAERLGLPYVMLMLHSSELMPGGSPYFPDSSSVENLYRLVEDLLSSLRKLGLSGETLEHFAGYYADGVGRTISRRAGDANPYGEDSDGNEGS